MEDVLLSMTSGARDEDLRSAQLRRYLTDQTEQAVSSHMACKMPAMARAFAQCTHPYSAERAALGARNSMTPWGAGAPLRAASVWAQVGATDPVVCTVSKSLIACCTEDTRVTLGAVSWRHCQSVGGVDRRQEAEEKCFHVGRCEDFAPTERRACLRACVAACKREKARLKPVDLRSSL